MINHIAVVITKWLSLLTQNLEVNSNIAVLHANEICWYSNELCEADFREIVRNRTLTLLQMPCLKKNYYSAPEELN